MIDSSHARLRLPTMLGYAVGSLGVGVYSTVPGVLLLYYMTQALGLPVALASLGVIAPKLAILVAEPMVGALSDRTRSRLGRRRPFLLVGALVSAAAFVALFNTPRFPDQTVTLVAIALAYLGASLSFSLFAVPYVAIPADLATDTRERARLVGCRMIFAFAGVLLGSALPPLLVERMGGGSLGYGRMAVVIAVVSLVAMLTSFAATPREVAQPAHAAVGGRNLRGVLGYPPYVLALAFYVVSMIGSGAFSAAAPYFVTYVLDAPQGALSALFAINILTAIAAMSPWTWLTTKLRFTRALALALLCGLAGAVLMGAGAGRRVFDLAPALVLLGVGTAGVQVAAFSLLADVISRCGRATGLRSEGLMTGLWTASEKVALALGPGVTGLILAIGGFVSGAPKVAQPASALDAARLAICLGPAIFFGLAAGLLPFARKSFDSDMEDLMQGRPPESVPEQVIG